MKTFDAIVVGAGFAGLYAVHRLRSIGLDVQAIEAADGVGGTWYWNRYPGARCDVESLAYSYGFSDELQREWAWTERYAAQAEILRYLNHVADRFDLRRSIRFNTRGESARFDERDGRWSVRTATGETLRARWLVMATGCLSKPNKSIIPGTERFGGKIYHTGEWPHEGVDFTGQRVGVVGTGSSGVQSIPHLAAQAKHLFVFQRTPTYSVPAGNHPLDAATVERVKANYAAFRERARGEFAAADWNQSAIGALEVTAEERRQEYDRRWARGGLTFMAAFADLLVNPEANATAADYVREKIRTIVKDPAVADLLSPQQALGCKRLCCGVEYFESFNRPNVTLVDVRADPIETMTYTGLQTSSRAYELDSIVFATGFDAMTGALVAIDIQGRNGLSLKEAWRDGPRSYLGLGVHGFPNFFTITGPGSPSVLANVVVSIEQHVEWIAGCIKYAEERGIGAMEATREAQDEWVEHINQIASGTLFPTCNSWYLGSNIAGKPRVFMVYIGGFPAYAARCKEVASAGYPGFQQS